jgi:hypothetical protein
LILMSTRSFQTLLLLPYLSLKNSFSISGFTFISVQNDLVKYVSGPELLAHIQGILTMYKNPSGHIVMNPTVVIRAGQRFRNPQARTMNRLHDIRSALIFSAFLKNKSWSFTTI